jgi:mannose-6-phosphate isomerase-like protein (cupin superfamily)
MQVLALAESDRDADHGAMSTATNESGGSRGAGPVDLRTALAGFDQLWSPRIVTKVNDYDVRVAKVRGDHVWHVHEATDEFFLLLDGELTIALREPDGGHEGDGEDGRHEEGGGGGGERVVELRRGSVFVVPRGVEHKPSSANGASILLFEPTGTSSVGDRHEEVPDHVDGTTGHPL